MGRVNYKSLAMQIPGARIIDDISDIEEGMFVALGHIGGFITGEVYERKSYLSVTGTGDVIRSIGSNGMYEYRDFDWAVELPQMTEEFVPVLVSELKLADIGLLIKFTSQTEGEVSGVLEAIGRNFLLVNNIRHSVSSTTSILIDRD